MSDVFISYSRKDKEFVLRLHEALSKKDRDTWVDWEDIPPTAEWLAEIFSAIEAADTFVFVISPDSVDSEVCQKEIARAVKCNKRIVPLERREVDDKVLPEALHKPNWIHFRDRDDFDSAFESLLKAIDMDLDWVSAHTRLLTKAIEWDNKGRDKSFLLRGSDLKEAEQWLGQGADKDPKPTSLQTQYIIASRKAATKRQRVTLGAVTFGLIVAIVLAVVAFNQRQKAVQQSRISLSRQLAAQSSSHLGVQLDLALLLSIEACRAYKTVEARGSLLTALVSRPYISKLLHGHTDAVLSVAFSPDGRTLASGSEDNTIILWDLQNHQQIGQPLKGHTSSVLSVAFNPDGTTLVSGSGDDTIIQWDVDVESWKARACRIANRNLTREEWQQYIGDESYRPTRPELPIPEG